MVGLLSLLNRDMGAQLMMAARPLRLAMVTLWASGLTRHPEFRLARCD